MTHSESLTGKKDSLSWIENGETSSPASSFSKLHHKVGLFDSIFQLFLLKILKATDTAFSMYFIESLTLFFIWLPIDIF